MVDLKKEFPNINPKYLDEIEEYALDIINFEDFIKQKEYIQHGSTSVYEHCILVTCKALEIADQKKFSINRKKLCRAALLHDYFKYDWHIYGKTHSITKLHGFYHPSYAAENAKKDFNIDDLEENAIRSHMWPLGFAFPHSKEAWILTMADKNCALFETYHKIKV